MQISPIGVIQTPFEKPAGTPIQPPGAEGIRGRVEVYPPYRDGLADVEGFSHIYLIYWFHRAGAATLRVTPFLDAQQRGVFATRSPARPNPIGLSVVRLLRVEDGFLAVEGVDMLDGTPLLDIKPYVPSFDHRPEARTGWLEQNHHRAAEVRADGRFDPELREEGED